MQASAGDILAEIDRAIEDSRTEASRVQNGAETNFWDFSTRVEYLYFLQCSEKAFRGLRQYLRSQEFADKLSTGKENTTNER